MPFDSELIFETRIIQFDVFWGTYKAFFMGFHEPISNPKFYNIFPRSQGCDWFRQQFKILVWKVAFCEKFRVDLIFKYQFCGK